jgi:predicted nucleic acid-binding protein
MSVVLDTTVLIDVLRGHQDAVDYVVALEEVPACSEITRVEVLQGLPSEERRAAEQLFQRLRLVAVDEAIARTAGDIGRQLRRSHIGVGVAELIIGATAMQLDLPLATTNIRHFPTLKGVRAPYRE